MGGRSKREIFLTLGLKLSEYPRRFMLLQISSQIANQFITPDFTYHARGEDITGVDKFKACVATDHTTFRDMHFTYIDGIAEGNEVATTWILEGVQQQEFRGIPATNKKFETVGVIIFRFEGALIKEGWAIVDGLTPAIQLGLVKTSFDST